MLRLNFSFVMLASTVATRGGCGTTLRGPSGPGAPRLCCVRPAAHTPNDTKEHRDWQRATGGQLKPRRSTNRSPARFIARTLDGATTAPFPGFIEPCCPTLRKVPPTGENWVHEIKHDGYRVQAHFDGQPRVYTRRGNEWAARMPSIAGAIKALPANNLIIDGELVALDPRGGVVLRAAERA